MTDVVAAAAALLGGLARPDEPLGERTTYRVGGRADLLVEVEGDDDLAAVAAAVAATRVPVLVVGRGSNLLVADAGFRGLAVVLGDRWAQVEVEGSRARAGGAASLPVLCAPAFAQAAQPAHYSVTETLVGKLIDDPAAAAILQNLIPTVWANDMFQLLGRELTLKAIQQYEAVLTDEKLAEIQAEFDKIPAKE